MKAPFLAAALLAFPVFTNVAKAECGSPLGSAVPDTATARAIATAVISARQKPEVSKKYRLFVEPDGEGAAGWIAVQALPYPRRGENRNILITSGGGGIRMRIDRCSGEISDMYYLR